MSELETLEGLHRAAQARLGFSIAFLSNASWAAVQAANPARAGSKWADTVAAAVVEAQELSAALAATYYQLARAIEIGVTLGVPRSEAEPTLGAYRDDFLTQVVAVAVLGDATDTTPLHALVSGSEELDRLDIMPSVQRFLDEMDESTDATAIRVDPYNWPTFRDDENLVADALYGKAVDPLVKQVKQIRQDKESADQVGEIETVHANKGSIGAGNADQLVMHAGRAVIEQAQVKDKRVLKYARGTGANPCHFCAMLASRGFVYASRKTAMSTYRTGGMRSYHPNCHCFPIARWSEASPLPQLNQEFTALWNKEIRGKYSGKAALKQWRRIITERQKDYLPAAPIEND